MRLFIAAMAATAAVLISIVPLLRADVEGWRILVFAVVSGLSIGILVWHMLRPLMPRFPLTTRVLGSKEVRQLVTPMLQEAWGLSQAEARIEDQLARTREMARQVDETSPRTRTVLEPGEPSCPAPTGHCLLVSVRDLAGKWRDVTCISPADMDHRLETDKGLIGLPVAYARVGDKILFWPRPDASYPVSFWTC